MMILNDNIDVSPIVLSSKLTIGVAGSLAD